MHTLQCDWRSEKSATPPSTSLCAGGHTEWVEGACRQRFCSRPAPDAVSCARSGRASAVAAIASPACALPPPLCPTHSQLLSFAAPRANHQQVQAGLVREACQALAGAPPLLLLAAQPLGLDLGLGRRGMPKPSTVICTVTLRWLCACSFAGVEVICHGVCRAHTDTGNGARSVCVCGAARGWGVTPPGSSLLRRRKLGRCIRA
jgi:hypothetical protein